MRHFATFTIVVLAAALLPAAAASAQESNLVTTPGANPEAPAGWSFKPSLTYSGAWDDNVLLRGTGNRAPADFLNVINPRSTVDYNGRRSQVSASYDGAFLLYHDLSALNSYDQHGWVFARRMLSRNVSLFLRNTVASVPTTELSQFVAIPFERTGSRLDALKGGVEIAFSKRTSLAAGYDFEWIDFDQSQPGTESLRGGHSHGASANLRHILDARLTLIADYSLQHALVATTEEIFDVQNASVGVEYKVSELTHVYAAGGISHLFETATATSKTGPAVRLGLSRHLRRAEVDVSYSRAFVASYGFGGATQNSEASARLRLPLARRVYTTGGVSWRRNAPLTEIDLPLRSLWVEGTVGYAMTPWASIELFYGGTHQTFEHPLDRNRYGFQVITAKPVRIH